jgi:hypothetical protein
MALDPLDPKKTQKIPRTFMVKLAVNTVAGLILSAAPPGLDLDIPAFYSLAIGATQAPTAIALAREHARTAGNSLRQTLSKRLGKPAFE